MIIDIPKNNDFFQGGEGDLKGSLWSTFNMDFNRNFGKVQPSTRMMWSSNTAEESNLEAPAVAFADNGVRYVAVADDRVWRTTSLSTANSLWEEAGSTPTDMSDGSDVKWFNDKFYVTADDNIKSYNGVSTFSSSLQALTGGASHNMTIFANRLYVQTNDTIVYSMDDTETFATSGSNTIDLVKTTGFDQTITSMESVSDGIWIATLFTDHIDGEMILWDGETENTAANRFKIPSGVLAMTIKDDRPYVLDGLGRLRVYDGTTFVEVARLPINNEQLVEFNSTNNDRFIHPNGMVATEKEILILINTTQEDSTLDSLERVPSGVWAYNKDNGFYHKWSPSNYQTSQSSTSGGTVVDYGMSEVSEVGALFLSQVSPSNTPDWNDQSDVLAGIKYYTDATTTSTGFFITDKDNDVIKSGYFTTTQIQAEQVRESWNMVHALYKQMDNATDKLVIKYKVVQDDPEYFTGTWSDDDTFTSTGSMTNVVAGDEVEIVRGEGAGLCAHISSISEAGGTYTVNLDESISGMSGTLKFRTQKWKKIDEVADTVNDMSSFAINEVSSWIQFKVWFVGTGKNPELHRLIIGSKVHTPVV